MDGQRKGLGRGLASLIPVKKDEVAVTTPPGVGTGGPVGGLMVPVSSIVPNPLQPRKFFDQHKIEELAQSVREKGVIVPVLAIRRGARFELVAGGGGLR